MTWRWRREGDNLYSVSPAYVRRNPNSRWYDGDSNNIFYFIKETPMQTNAPTKKMTPGGGKLINSPLKDTVKSGNTSTRRDNK